MRGFLFSILSRIIFLMHREKRTRSILKAITYRILSIIIDGTIAYAITQNTKQTITLVLISNLVSIIVYFIHERAWNRVHWGKHTIEINTEPFK